MAYSRQFKVCAIIVIVGGGILTMILLNKYIKKTKYKCPADELFFKGTNRCYEKGSQIPCSNNLVLLEREPGSPLGACGCPHSESKRPLLFDWKTHHCYYIFSRGFCDEGFWINATIKTGEPVCEENFCLKEFDDSGAIPDEIVPIARDKCGILNQSAEECKENQKLQYFGNHIYARCEAKIKLGGAGLAAIAIGPSPCPLGSYPSIIGKCTPDFDF